VNKALITGFSIFKRIEMIKIGCCGYPTSMQRYFRHFKLVEINTTFYQYPRSSTIERWRGNAPSDFEFAVKAHQQITHKSKMKLEEASEVAFQRMKEICRTLNAKVLLFQTPASFKPEKLETAKRFFAKIKQEDLTIVWETRGSAWESTEVREKLNQALKEVGVSHVVDPFKSSPVYAIHVAYFRLHGLGERLYYYQYTDSELKQLKSLVEPFLKNGLEVYVLFNNLAMMQDAIRFKIYLETGNFPRITAGVGFDSIKEVISRTRFPVSKSMLLRKLGWRIVEIQENKQERLDIIIKNLPSKTYKTLEDLLKEIKRSIESKAQI